MKQLIQNLKNGQTLLDEVPVPRLPDGSVLVQSRVSLVSAGTEKMLVEFSRASLLEKARLQPEKVKMVWEKIRSDGFLPTLEAVFSRLDQPLPLGYCNAGIVRAVGRDVHDLRVGDRVASNGPHAEMVAVPRHLAARIPDTVTDEEAAFTAIASIGLQSIRLLGPTLGETIVVTGLGLVGLLTAELLLLNGCRVIGIDPDVSRLDIAAAKGIITCNPAEGNDPVRFVADATAQAGADGVIIAASSRSDELLSQAARMSRKRGRIILSGVTGLQLNRADFYEKELTFQVSCSYGPGRYDDSYEQQGKDYPQGFVRWTENRNFQAVLQLMADGRLDVKPLISGRFPLHDYQKIYGSIGAPGTLASLLIYPESMDPVPAAPYPKARKIPAVPGAIGIIGAGHFTKRTLLPAFGNTGVKYIASASGISGNALARKYGIPHSVTDYGELLSDPEVSLVMITTRHHLHSSLALEALRHGKHVFVEKPLAIFDEELDSLQRFFADHPEAPSLTVGFNRRFAPLVRRLKSLAGTATMNLVITVNAGFVPKDSWLHDRSVGGGRLIGEACHFIDLAVFLTGSCVAGLHVTPAGPQPCETTDSAHILLRMENGSTAAISYLADGSKAYAKERIEVYSQGRTFVLDNFRKLTGYGVPGFSSASSVQDKGHKEQFRRVRSAWQEGGDPPVPLAEIFHVSRATLAIAGSIRQRSWIDLAPQR